MSRPIYYIDFAGERYGIRPWTLRDRNTFCRFAEKLFEDNEQDGMARTIVFSTTKADGSPLFPAVDKHQPTDEELQAVWDADTQLVEMLFGLVVEYNRIDRETIQAAKKKLNPTLTSNSDSNSPDTCTNP